jgi:uncharacterized protein DUF5687
MRSSAGLPKLFLLLSQQQLRRRVRGLKSRGKTVTTVVMALFAAYIGFTLFTLGAYLPVFVAQMAPGTSAQGLVNRHALSMLVGLFFLRFLIQKTPKMYLEPYLHLPVPRAALVGFFSVTSVFSVHNLFPLVFAVPYAVVHLAPAYGAAGAAQWVGSIVAALLASNFLNIYFRTQMNRREHLFLGGLGLLLVLSLADEYLGAGVMGKVSLVFFTEMLRPSVLLVLALSGLVLGTSLFAAGALLEALRREDPAVMPPQQNSPLYEMAERWDLAGHLIWLELRLMWRNRRPRHYLLVSIMFSTVYLVFMLASPALFGGFIFGAILGLFASGGFVLNYGQLMFSWDSSYMDGLLARAIRIRALTRAKTMVLQGSCLFLFVLSLPLFLWLRPDLVPLHVAFLFYNAGITSQVIMELATRNRERIDLGRSGGFFNYEGFSARHWIWFLPTALPPTILLFVLRNQPHLAWTALAAVGLIGLATTELWTRRHASRVHRQKHAMLAGFAVQT